MPANDRDDQVEAVKAARKRRAKPEPARSDAARTRLGVINPYSRTYGPIKIGVGETSSGLKRA